MEGTNDVVTIRLGVGLGELKFGASRDDVRLYLGDPEDVNEDLLSFDPSIAWYYWEAGLSAHFDGEDDFRLGTIQIEREDAELLGMRMIGRPRHEALAMLAPYDLGPVEEEGMESAESPTMRVMRWDEQNLDLWFDDGKVDAIQWGCFIDQADRIVWP